MQSLFSIALETVRKPGMFSQIISSYVPDYVTREDWIAFNLVDLNSELSLVCSILADFCSAGPCAVSEGTGGSEFVWEEVSAANPRARTLSSLGYIETLTAWMDRQTTTMSSTPEAEKRLLAEVTLGVMARRVPCLYSHIFICHGLEMQRADHHMKYSLLHFLAFMWEADVRLPRRELERLRPTIVSMNIPRLYNKYFSNASFY